MRLFRKFTTHERLLLCSIIVLFIVSVLFAFLLYRQYQKPNNADASQPIAIVLSISNTLTTVSVAYFVTEKKNDIRSARAALNNLLDSLVELLKDSALITPTSDNREKILLLKRQISNKIDLLNKFSGNYISTDVCNNLKRQLDSYESEISIYFDNDFSGNKSRQLDASVSNMIFMAEQAIVNLYA